MADKTIGELPVASSLNDDSLLVVEQQGEARSIQGRLIASFAKSSAAADVQRAVDAANAAEASRETMGGYLDAAKQSAEEAASSALSAQQYSGKPPIIKENNWWTWDAEAQDYTDTGKKAALNYDKTYPSIDEMEADKDNQPENTLAIISTGINEEDNARLYIKDADGTWRFLADLSGFTGVGIETWEKTEGTGSAGTTDTYTLTLTDGREFTYTVYNGADGTGAGDMLRSVYDTDGRNLDIFQYVDDLVGDIKTVLEEINGEASA